MQTSQPTSPRCPHCGADKFTFREVFGPATALEEHENQRAKISGLHQQLHEIGELIQQTSAGYAAQAEEAAAAAIVRRRELSEKLSGHQATLAQLVATRDRLLAPLRERAKQAAEATFRQQVEKDPTALLYDTAEERLAEKNFAKLVDKARQADARFAQLLEHIESANADIDLTEAAISRLDHDEKSAAATREQDHTTFIAAQNEQRDGLRKPLRAAEKTLARTELRCQAALMYCVECGASLGAVASPIPFDEWMTLFDATASEGVKQIAALADNVAALGASVESLQKETVAGYRTMQNAIESMSANLERAVVSSNAQLAQALAGSFKSIQEGMNSLVARANQAATREKIEDFRKIIGG